jgi:hypothetical protein
MFTRCRAALCSDGIWGGLGAHGRFHSEPGQEWPCSPLSQIRTTMGFLLLCVGYLRAVGNLGGYIKGDWEVLMVSS